MSHPFVPRVEKTENDVEWNIVTWMQRQGWIAERANVGLLYTQNGTPQRIGRPGQCDWRFKRSRLYPLDYIEIEIKAPGGTPSRVQREYMASMKSAGIVALWFDSFASFEQQYSNGFQ